MGLDGTEALSLVALEEIGYVPALVLVERVRQGGGVV
jgi:hypothetical protein